MAPRRVACKTRSRQVSVTLAALIFGLAAHLAGDVAGPAVQVPSNVAWTEDTIARATSGNALRGLLIARRCDHCHGREGFSSSPTVPNLAGMDRLVVWKQLDDFRSGKRLSRVMQPIAGGLTFEDVADLAAYYWIMPVGPDPVDDRSFPQPLSDPKREPIAIKLMTLGDGSRGIPPCGACHGPMGFVSGAPSLATQNATYMVEQLESFASGARANDINLRMRSIARQLTDEERHALAESYGAGLADQNFGAGR